MKRRLKILLVNPYIQDFKLYDEWMKPLGLYHLSSMIKSTGQADLYYINCLDRTDASLPRRYRRINNLGKGDFYREEIAKPDLFKDFPRTYKRYGLPATLFQQRIKELPYPDYILVSSLMTYWYPGYFYTIDLLRKAFPNSKIALGGIYASLCKEHAEKYSGADYIFSSLNYQESLQDFSNWIGLDLTSSQKLPLDYSLENQRFLSIMLRSGCPFKCSYCASHLLCGHDLKMDISSAFSLISGFAERGITNICFYDDALLYKFDDNLNPLLDKVYHKYGSSLKFHCPNGLHARYITRDVAARLYKTGFKTIRLGFETAEKSISKSTGNKIQVSSFLETVDNLKMAGYSSGEIGVYVMAGISGSGLDRFYEDISTLMQTKVLIKPVVYSPIPGTLEFKYLSDKYPVIKSDPLSHNDLYFLFNQQGEDFDRFNEIKKQVARYNTALKNINDVQSSAHQ